MSDVTIRQLASMPIGDLIRGLENEEFSVLKAAHSAKLRAEMRGTGLICRAVLWLASMLAGGTKKYRNIRKMRKKLASMLAWGAPCKITGKPEREADCIVMGFNHPSLGEIARFVYVHLNYFDDRFSLFPVNLPWYEALAPKSEILRQLGIILVPILTPSTLVKISKNVSKSEMTSLQGLASALNNHYIRAIAKLAEAERCAIWVAPSATRQATVFRNEDELNDRVRIEPQTITLLATALHKSGKPYSLVPVGVAPKKRCSRGLNLFKEYKLCFANSMSYDYVEYLRTASSPNYRGRQLEFKFREQIAWALLRLKRSDLVCAYENSEQK